MRPGEFVADRFRIERLAGRGGMGAVYRAHDNDTGQPVALKVMIGEGEELTERFAREIQLLSELQHRSIVRYVAQGVTANRDWFLATEWFDGERLADRLRRGPLTVVEALALGLVVADALSDAHVRNIVHRDLKPSNLFLVDGSCADPRILDFGVARLRAGASSNFTVMGAALGTPGYISPEQARGDELIDVRADVFALGCVLFHCLTGELVWEGDSPMSMLYLVVTEPARRARDLRADLPVELDALLDRMLQKQQNDRPADGNALWQALYPIAAAHGIEAVRGESPKLPQEPAPAAAAPSAATVPTGAPQPPAAAPAAFVAPAEPRTIPWHPTAAEPPAFAAGLAPHRSPHAGAAPGPLPAASAAPQQPAVLAQGYGVPRAAYTPISAVPQSHVPFGPPPGSTPAGAEVDTLLFQRSSQRRLVIILAVIGALVCGLIALMVLLSR